MYMRKLSERKWKKKTEAYATARSAMKAGPLTLKSVGREFKELMIQFRRRRSRASAPNPPTSAAAFGSGTAVMVTKLLPVRSLV